MGLTLADIDAWLLASTVVFAMVDGWLRSCGILASRIVKPYGRDTAAKPVFADGLMLARA